MRDPLTPLLLGLAVLAVGLSPLWVPSAVAWIVDHWIWGRHE